MDQTGIYICLGILTLFGAIAWWWRRQHLRVEMAQTWPAAEATIESGALETVKDSNPRSPIILPVFTFSYQVADEYYSGRFALSHLHTDADDLIQRLIGRKLQLRFNPSSPDIWFIPDTEIEGCRVEQKMGPHLIALYPKE
jgi:hypothetical protein